MPLVPEDFRPAGRVLARAVALQVQQAGAQTREINAGVVVVLLGEGGVVGLDHRRRPVRRLPQQVRERGGRGGGVVPVGGVGGDDGVVVEGGGAGGNGARVGRVGHV